MGTQDSFNVKCTLTSPFFKYWMSLTFPEERHDISGEFIWETHSGKPRSALVHLNRKKQKPQYYYIGL